MNEESAAASAGPSFERFVALIARLRAPGGCPWDREQTHASLKPMTIEEAAQAGHLTLGLLGAFYAGDVP
jgi:hypothetical protein